VLHYIADCKDADRYSAWCIAASAATKIDVNAQSENGYTPLHYAAKAK
jgi:hypothetical protein